MNINVFSHVGMLVPWVELWGKEGGPDNNIIVNNDLHYDNDY